MSTDELSPAERAEAILTDFTNQARSAVQTLIAAGVIDNGTDRDWVAMLDQMGPVLETMAAMTVSYHTRLTEGHVPEDLAEALSGRVGSHLIEQLFHDGESPRPPAFGLFFGGPPPTTE